MNDQSRMLKGSNTWKAASPEAPRASRRGTGGVIDCGTAEEDGPVTWEAPVRPRRRGAGGNAGMGVGLRPGGKRPDAPPNPGAARAANRCGGTARWESD